MCRAGPQTGEPKRLNPGAPTLPRWGEVGGQRREGHWPDVPVVKGFFLKYSIINHVLSNLTLNIFVKTIDRTVSTAYHRTADGLRT